MMLKEALVGVMQRQHLRREEMAANVGLMLAQIGALAAALLLKGETEDELLGAAETLRAAARLSPKAERVLDTCGTGGDGAHTFNISISEEDAT